MRPSQIIYTAPSSIRFVASNNDYILVGYQNTDERGIDIWYEENEEKQAMEPVEASKCIFYKDYSYCKDCTLVILDRKNGQQIGGGLPMIWNNSNVILSNCGKFILHTNFGMLVYQIYTEQVQLEKYLDDLDLAEQDMFKMYTPVSSPNLVPLKVIHGNYLPHSQRWLHKYAFNAHNFVLPLDKGAEVWRFKDLQKIATIECGLEQGW